MTAEEIAKGMRAYAHQLIEIADILHPIDKKVPRTREKVLPLGTEVGSQGGVPLDATGHTQDSIDEMLDILYDNKPPSGEVVEGSQDEQ